MKQLTASLGTFAAELGLSRDVLRRIISEASVSPVAKSGGHPVYRLRDVFAAVQKQQDASSLNPHARLALAKAVLAEDEIRRTRRELYERLDVEQEMARIFRIVALFADTLPDVLERDCGLTTDQLSRLDRAIDQVREALYTQLTENGDDATDTIGDRPSGPAGGLGNGRDSVGAVHRS